jgi:hypothetical protein
MSSWLYTLLALHLFVIAFPDYGAAASEAAPITPADAIAIAQVVPAASRDVALYSPDGSTFVIVEKKADLERNLIRYSLLLWRTAGALQGSDCERLVTMSSSSVRPAIHSLT